MTTATKLKSRHVEKPTLGDIARISNRASALLRIKDENDERVTAENQATLTLARQFKLVS